MSRVVQLLELITETVTETETETETETATKLIVSCLYTLVNKAPS